MADKCLEGISTTPDIMVDQRLNVKLRMKYSAVKAFITGALIARTVLTVGDSRPNRQLLILRMVSSILIYTAKLWALENKSIKNKIELHIAKVDSGDAVPTQQSRRS